MRRAGLILLLAWAAAAHAESPVARATWIWKGWDVISKPERQAELFRFCEERRLTDLYICFPPQKLAMPEARAQLESFVREAHARRLRVHLLTGSVEMAYSPHSLQKIIDQLAGYNESVSAESRLDGLHLDIEPHTMGALWTQDDRLRNRFMETMKKYAEKFAHVRGLMTLGLDIPVGFADDPELLNALLDSVDYVAIMDYRDSPGPIIFGAEEILEAAGKKNKKAIVGVETQAPSKKYGVIPPLTFWDEGSDRMEEVLAQVGDRFKSDPAFGGFAVHSYEAYRELPRGPRPIADSRIPPKLPPLPIARAAAVKIDGDLGEWRAQPPIQIREPRQVVHGKTAWQSADDLSAECWLGWDDQNLYLAAAIMDDAIVQPFEPRKMVNGDHLELWLELDGALWQIGVSPGNFRDQPPGIYDWLPGRSLIRPEIRIDLAARKTPKGYELELKIPWAALGRFRPTAGKTIRINVDPSDTDGAEKPIQETLMSTSHFREWGNPATFRTGEFK